MRWTIKHKLAFCIQGDHALDTPWIHPACALDINISTCPVSHPEGLCLNHSHLGYHYLWHPLDTTLLVFKRFFNALDIFIAVSAVVRAAPIVGAAVWDEYARLRRTNSLFTSLTNFNQQTSFFNIFLAICLLCSTISLPGLQWHPLAAMSKCIHREHIVHMGREWQFESFARNIIVAVFFGI